MECRIAEFGGVLQFLELGRLGYASEVLQKQKWVMMFSDQ